MTIIDELNELHRNIQGREEEIHRLKKERNPVSIIEWLENGNRRDRERIQEIEQTGG